MALINCPECNEPVSDTVKKCPHCGYNMRKGKHKKVKKQIMIVLIIIILGSLCVGGYFFYTKVFVPSTVYKKAEKQIENKEYNEAIKNFESIKNYKNSSKKVLEAYYKQGLQFSKDKQYDKAISDFEAAGDYEDAKEKLAQEKKAEERDSTKKLLKMAYGLHSSSNTTLSADGLSITVDSKNKYDLDGLGDIMLIISELKLPDSLLDEMKTTTALMGKQTESFDNYEVSWSYHPDNGLDAIFKVKE